MGAVTITVDSPEVFKQRIKAAFAGKHQEERISFSSFDVLWKVLAPNRMALLQTLAGAGPVTLREARDASVAMCALCTLTCTRCSHTRSDSSTTYTW